MLLHSLKKFIGRYQVFTMFTEKNIHFNFTYIAARRVVDSVNIFFIFVVFLLFTGLSFDTCQCSANVAFVLCQKVRTCVFIMYSIVTYTSLLSSLSDH